MVFGAMLSTHPLRRVQAAVIAFAVFLAWWVLAKREDESLALVAGELAGLVAGTIFTLWLLEREGRQDGQKGGSVTEH